jgi:signal transduction histidine kinase
MGGPPAAAQIGDGAGGRTHADCTRSPRDQLGQQLTGAAPHPRTANAPAMRGRRDVTNRSSALKMAEELDRAVDFLAWELRPAALDDLGLASRAGRAISRSGRPFPASPPRFRGKGFSDGMLSPAMRRSRSISDRARRRSTTVPQDAHAGVSTILSRGARRAVVMVVADNGIGFDPSDGACTRTASAWPALRERGFFFFGGGGRPDRRERGH